MIQVCTHHLAIVVQVTAVTLTSIVDSTHEHFCKTPEMSIADVLFILKQSMGRGKGLNLTLYKIKLSRKKNIGATSHKIKNESTSPTFPTVQM